MAWMVCFFFFLQRSEFGLTLISDLLSGLDELLVDSNDASEDGSSSEDDEEWGGIAQEQSEPTSDSDDEVPLLQPTTSTKGDSNTLPQPTRYIPPHLRNSQSQLNQSQLQLVRQLKGLINRYMDIYIR